MLKNNSIPKQKTGREQPHENISGVKGIHRKSSDNGKRLIEFEV